ncbi:MAG: DM13 domain-containing protein [Aeromonas salmonicida]|uniref:DM13 domain-containing protein n=1 Tax=Aeromonas salmonicida TaxID=645 RepID=UPI001026A580|nr:DM13 domain-containing protein [Aeromonas salmonicida]VFB11190.1 Phenylalanyl-tRNA synthetase subunit beta [Aeromonas salmonicida]
MKRKTMALLVGTHLLVAAAGFATGIYTLPILIAPPAPSSEAVAASQQQASFSGTFHRDLKDSDRLHWGEGKVSIGPDAVSLMGQLAPGPDYQLYLSLEFVETEADFSRLKSQMVHVGPVKTFDNFIVPLPASIDPARYTSVIVWCETFGQFITAARYR